MTGIENDAQVSGLQIWVERVSLIEIGNSGSWRGVDFNFGHDHVEFEVSLRPQGDLLSRHWFMEFWSLKKRCGVDRT